ncbi:hypothetical protein ASA1KI_13530 [Opitutales bacterium ASA1]|uniref:GDYXXLXY domain-containing protein n=1 Tax=Congregicoccus parvus TaxID=3081749 RepID=UPI002B2ECA5A|nr:hypothetical protein ASA1KI_13530 [Opitutales bacterium ASA1]
MKRPLFILAAFAQLAVLAFMAGEREWIARMGTRVLLRTAPIDPYDPMRGAYVRLDYDMSVVPRTLCGEALQPWFTAGNAPKDAIVYAALSVSEDGLAELARLDATPPESGPFLRGRVGYLFNDTIHVRYGIEAFFMQQDKALALEREMFGERRGSLLEVEARVSDRGIAVLLDYTWEPLGITLEFERAEPVESEMRFRREVVAVTAVLKNHGEAPVAIVDRPDAGSFRLVRNQRLPMSGYSWVGADSPPAPASADDVRVLAPGTEHRVRIDLANPEWFVVPEQGGAPISITSLAQNWNASFRVEYAPPTSAELARLPDSPAQQRRPLRSAAFTPGGAVD